MTTREPAKNQLAVSLGQAAELLSISKRSVETLVASGNLPSRRLGKRRLIRFADLQRLLAHDQPTITRAETREQ